MAKIYYLAPFLFILLNLLCFVQNQGQEDTEWIEFWDEMKGFTKDFKEYETKKRFAVEFNSTSSSYTGPLYLKIEVIPEEGKAPPLLCFSTDDPSCEKREILSRNPTGKSVVIWAKKQQFQDQKNEPYFVVTCPNNAQKCEYKIVGSGDIRAVFSPDFVYSYLVTKKNKDSMDFKIDNKELNIKQRLVVCLQGSSLASLKIYDAADIFEEENIRCANINITDDDLANEDFGKISVRDAKEGEYLTLSAHTYTFQDDDSSTRLGRANNNFALPNGPIISGLIYTPISYEECFPISKETFDKSSDNLYITGKIYSKYAWFFLEDKNGKIIESTDEEITDGLFSFILKKQTEDMMLCFEIPHAGQDEEKLYYEQNLTMFSFQIVDYNNIIEPFGYTEPMIVGDTYRKLLPKGKIAYYYGGVSQSQIKHHITLTRRKGLPQLYIGECKFFPNCSFSKEDLQNLNEFKVSTLNNQKIWLPNVFVSSAIGTQKHAMVVYCEDNELNGDYCEFDMNIIAQGQDIVLIENEKFSKFVETGVGNLIVDLKRDRIVERVTIDIMIFNGDITFELDDSSKNLEHKIIFLSNKVVINIYKPKEALDKVIIKYNAVLNSFFSIKYTVDSENKEQLEEVVSSGESYLVQINPSSNTKKKSSLYD